MSSVLINIKTLYLTKNERYSLKSTELEPIINEVKLAFSLAVKLIYEKKRIKPISKACKEIINKPDLIFKLIGKKLSPHRASLAAPPDIILTLNFSEINIPEIPEVENFFKELKIPYILKIKTETKNGVL